MSALTGEERSRFFSLLPEAAKVRQISEEDPVPLALASGLIWLIANGLSDHIVEFVGAGETAPCDEARGRVLFEELLFTLQCVGRFGFTRQNVKKRGCFMGELVSSMQ